MGPIEKAIDEFRGKRLGVYRADRDQIVRDARTAKRAATDHVGRWFFELLQNCDDARASKVLVRLEDDAVYVADDGDGFKPEAVRAICGTDFSDKTSGTIGRKGVGFKSVYEISPNPQLLTVNGEGIEFTPQKAREWLRQNDLGDDYVAHQWIPFFLSWDEAHQQCPVLGKFGDYKTVVRLPTDFADQGRKQRVEEVLQECPPHALFAFRHVREIRAPHFEITLIPGDNTWEMRDSRNTTPAHWRVAKCTEHVPQEEAASLGEDEPRAISADGVSFLVGAPIKDDCATPTEEYLPVHVFYPTEQRGPVRLLLHAEFLVKSDRTALLPIEHSPFNRWVAERLAFHVCAFVQNSYSPAEPSRHLALVVPFGERETHPVASSLWKRIGDKAKEQLRLGDVEGKPRLKIAEAKRVSVSVRSDLAREILEATHLRGQLLHHTFDEDNEARKALTELGCEGISDQDLMKVIDNHAGSKAADQGWLWTCWEWLAAWLAEKPDGEERKQRSERVRGLPIIPVDGCVRKSVELSDRIVTWRPDEDARALPDWLPLTFVDDWFRDQIAALPKAKPGETASSLQSLLKELKIAEPDKDVIQRAVGNAIEVYWKDRHVDPGRFLQYILGENFHQAAECTGALQRCPVAVTRSGQHGIEWAEARVAYFGADWGNDLLAQLYAGNPDIPWAQPFGSNSALQEQREILTWLGVAECPRLIEEKCKYHLSQLPEACNDWRNYLQEAHDASGRRVEMIASVARLDRIVLEELDGEPAAFLIRLLAKNWSGYYRSRCETEASGTFPREQYYRLWQVNAMWWYEVSAKLVPPTRSYCADRVTLAKCWLADKRTEHAVGDLLPIIDTSAFGEDEVCVRLWLENVVRLRTRIEQLTADEWREILSDRIPRIAPADKAASDKRIRNKVTRWYEVCLEAVSESGQVQQGCFVSCPVLCRKGEEWSYLKDEPRYLEDDRELGLAFGEDVWLVSLSSRLKSDASKYLGIPPLSESAKETPDIPSPQEESPKELLEAFGATLPYVYAERCSKSSEHRENAGKLRERLKCLVLFVAPGLRSNVELNGINKVIDRPFIVDGKTIMLRKEDCGEPVLAQALAEVLAVRSEAADFCENLLRCKNDEERKSKLRTKGLAEADIARVDEFDAPSSEEQEERVTRAGARGPLAGPSPEGPGLAEPPKADAQQPVGAAPQPTSGGPLSDTNQQPTSKQPEKKDFELVDPEATEYVVGAGAKVPAGSGWPGGGGGGQLPVASSLSQEQKNDIEGAGRTLACRELRKMGYEVEQMPLDNPGFDLGARKAETRELRIEVKAHLGRETVVDLTAREYREYVKRLSGEYDWQLWNIEHLKGDDAVLPTITKYAEIPDEALQARSFRVDLKDCSPPV